MFYADGTFPLPCFTSTKFVVHWNVIFLLVGQYCNYPWYNNVIYLEDGGYGYWDCHSDCWTLPDRSYLCMYMEGGEFHDAASKCDYNKSCSVDVRQHDISGTDCCTQGNCEDQQTHVTAFIWSCIPGTVKLVHADIIHSLCNMRILCYKLFNRVGLAMVHV